MLSTHFVAKSKINKEKYGLRQAFVMNDLSGLVRLVSVKGEALMKEDSGKRKSPIEGYLIAGAALALLFGIVLLKARA